MSEPTSELDTTGQNLTRPENAALTARQQMALPYIAATPSVTRGAKAANIARATLHVWMKDPAFRSELERARKDAVELAHTELQGLALKSVAALAGLLEHPDPRVRSVAVRTALHHAARVSESREVRQRVELLDRAVTLLKNEM